MLLVIDVGITIADEVGAFVLLKGTVVLGMIEVTGSVVELGCAVL